MCSILAASTKQISFTFLVYLHECQKKSIVMKYNYKYLLSVDIKSFIYTLHYFTIILFNIYYHCNFNIVQSIH